MYNLATIFLYVLIFLFLLVMSYRIYLTLSYMKVEVPMIDSADNNISSSKIDELIEGFKKMLNLNDFSIIYTNKFKKYKSPFKMIDYKKKIIKIPYTNFTSVGYELDYIFSSIWFCSMLFYKSREFNFLKLVLHTLSKIGKVFFYIPLLLLIILLIVDKTTLFPTNWYTRFTGIVYKYLVLHAISFIGFLVLMYSYFFTDTNSIKKKIEEMYEANLSIFINNYEFNYKRDIQAARVYSNEIKKMAAPLFRLPSSEFKIISPFTFYI